MFLISSYWELDSTAYMDRMSPEFKNNNNRIEHMSTNCRIIAVQNVHKNNTISKT